MAYLKSEAVTLFPSAYRGCYTSGAESGKVYDPESRLFTEKNSGYPYRALSSVKDGSFVVDFDKTNSIIKFVLHGYYFEADFYTGGETELLTNNLWAIIKLANKGLSASGNYQALSLINQSGDQNVLDTNDYFCGVRFETSAPITTSGEYALQLLSGGEVFPTSYQKFKAKEVQIGTGMMGESYALSDLISNHSVGGVNADYTLNRVLVGNQSGTFQGYATLEPSKLSLIWNNASATSGEEKIVLNSSAYGNTPGLTLNKKGITVNGADVKLVTSGGVAANLDVSGNITSKSNISASGSISATSSGNISSVSGDIYTLSGDVYSNTGKIYTGNGDIKITSSGSIYTKSGDIKITESGNIYTASGNIYTEKGSITAVNGNVSANSGDFILANTSSSGFKTLRTNFPQKIEVTDYSSASGGYKIEVTSENGSNIISKGGSTVASFDIKHVPIIDTKALTTLSTSGSTSLPILYTANNLDQNQKYICSNSKFGMTYNTGSTTYGKNYIYSPAFKEDTTLLEDKYIKIANASPSGGVLYASSGSGADKVKCTAASSKDGYHLVADGSGSTSKPIWSGSTYLGGPISSGSAMTVCPLVLATDRQSGGKSIYQSTSNLYFNSYEDTLFSNKFEGTSFTGTNFTGTTFTGTNYYGTSDARLKENVVDTSLDSVKLLSDIKIRDFNWKKDKSENKNVGVIAQELGEILPEEYKKEFIASGEYLAVNDSKFVYVLIDAFKKLKAEVDELKDKLGGK